MTTTTRKLTIPKKLTKDTLRILLKKAIKELADGHPTRLAEMIEYDYSNMSAVYMPRNKQKTLPYDPTERFCKLIGVTDQLVMFAVYRSQWLK